MSPVGILLAAGAATRFGSSKLLAPLADGTPVGIAAARTLRRVLPRCIAVVRPRDEALAVRLAFEGIEVLPCTAAAGGMGYSLAHAVAASRWASGWVVALADMPWVRPETVTAVAERLRDGAPLVAPMFKGQRGHPVGFGAAYGDRLAALGGGIGARELLAAHADLLVGLESDDPGVVLDVDRPGDLRQTPAERGAWQE